MAGAIRTDLPGRTVLHTWNLTTSDPTGDSMSHPGSSDRVVQFVVINAGGSTFILEGSLNNVDFFTLTDGQGNLISFTGAGGELIAENMLHYRPRLLIAGTAADITVLLFSRSTMR